MFDLILNYFNNHYYLFLLFIITIIYFLIASFEDFKKKEVFNFINFSYLFISIFIIILYSISQNSFELFFIGMFGIFLGFFLGSILFFLGIWGGGDAKFLIPFGGVLTLLITNSSILFSVFDIFIIPLNLYENTVIRFLDMSILFLTYFFIIFNVFLIIYILYKLFTNKNIFHLYLPSFYLFIFIIIGLFSLLPFIPFELRVITTLIFIMSLFIIPNSSFFIFSKFKSMLVSSLKQEMNVKEISYEELYLSHPITNKSKEIEPFKLHCEQLTVSKIEELEKKGLSNSSYINVVTIPPIIPFFLFQLLIIMFLLIFQFKEQNLLLLFKFIEFLLISFLVGGLYVFVLVLFNSLLNIKLIYSSIPKYRIFTYIIALIISTIMYIFYTSELLQQISLMGGIIVLSIFLFEITKIIEKKIFVVRTEIKYITLGDWIVEDVIVDNKIIFRKEDFKLGIEEHQLGILNDYYKKNKLKSLNVKSGIAFIPHLFIGFIFLIVLNFIY